MTTPVNNSDNVDITGNTNTEQQPNNTSNTNEQPTTQAATNQEYLPSSSSSPLPQVVLDSKALNQMPANSRQSVWVSSHPLTQPPSSEQISQPTTTKTTRISSTRAMNNNNKKNIGHQHHHPSSSLSVDTTMMMRPQQQQQHHSKSQSVPSSPIHSTTSSFNNSSSVSLPSSPTATPTTTTTTTPASSTTTVTTTTNSQQAQKQKQSSSSSSSSSASQQQQQQKEEKKYSDYLYGAIPTIVQNTTQQQNGLEAIIQYFNHRSQLENDYSLELKKMSQSFSLGGAPLTNSNNNANSTSHDHASSTTTTSTSATTATSASASASATSMGFTGQLAQVVNGMKNMSERLSLRHSNFSKDIQFCMCGPLTDFNNDLGVSKKRLLNAAQQLDKDLMIGLNAVEKNKHRQHRVAKEAEDTIIKAQKAIQKAMSSNNGDDDNDCTKLSSSPSTTNSTMFHYENNKWKQMTEKAVRDAKIADMQYSDTVTQMRLYQQRFKDDMGNILNSFQSNDVQLLQICKTFLNHYISFEEQLVRDFQKDLEVLRNAVNQIDVSETVDQFIVANQTNQRAPDLIPYEPYLSPYLNSNRKDDVPSSQSYSSSPSNNASSVSHHGSFSSPSKSGPIVKPQKPRGLSTTSSTRENTFVIPTRKSTRSNAELSAAMNNANNPNNGAIPSKGQRLQKWFHNFTNNQLKLLPRSAPDGDAFETMHEVTLTKPSRPLPPLPTEEQDDLPTNPTTTETMSSSIASASLDATTNTDTTSDVSSTATSNTEEDKKEADLGGINAEDQQLLKDIMSNFDDQEFRRDRLDIQEVKAYEALLTRVFAIGELSEEDQDELVTQVNELSDKLELPPSMGTRLALAMAMNHIRADPCIENAKAFTIVAQLVTTAMERSHEYGDANVGRLFLNMSQTFYRKKRNGSEETQEYLQQYLRDLLVWKDIRFWEGAFFDALSYERKKSEWNAQKKWRYLDKEQRAEVVVQHENMVFGLLGSFAFNMLNMGVAVQDCRLFMEKMCMINSLKDEYTELLMNNIDTTYIAIRAAEETPSSSASSNTRGRTVSMPTVPRSPARPRANANILVEEENQTVYLSDSETNSDEFDSNGSFVASSSFVFPSFKENYFQPNTRAT